VARYSYGGQIPEIGRSDAFFRPWTVFSDLGPHFSSLGLEIRVWDSKVGFGTRNRGLGTRNRGLDVSDSMLAIVIGG